MPEERRNSSIEMMIMEIGELKQLSTDNGKILKELSERVGIQNGRVFKIEKWQAFIQGAITILVLLVAPVFLQFASKFLIFLMH